MLTISLQPRAEGHSHAAEARDQVPTSTRHHGYPRLPDREQTRALDQALEQFHHGEVLDDHEMREVGLTNTARLLHDMHHQGIDLNVHPRADSIEEFALQIREDGGFQQISSRRSKMGKLRTCLFIAHLACGFNVYDPADSTITELTEIDQPASPYRMRFNTGI